MTLSLDAIKIRQKDHDIYVSAVRASDLLNNYRVGWWSRNDQSGYQRPLRQSRLREIQSYLTKDIGTFPTSVLANVRGKINVKPIKRIDAKRELCEVTIPDSSLPLWIIDGQHRVEGLKAAIENDSGFGDFPIIVSLFTLNDTYDEMLQFHIVNSRAKSVPTDLAQRHIFRMASKIGLAEVMAREGERDALGAAAIAVVDRLMKDENSPWYERIQLPDEPRKQPGEVIRQRPLSDSIHYILKEKHVLQRDPDKLAKLLGDYWTALKEIFPIAFENPEEYTIQKTTGAYSLHMVFSEVYDKCEEAGAINKDKMKLVLKEMFKKTSERLGAEINDQFWSKTIDEGHHLAQSTSQKMIKALAQYFREALWE